MTHRKESPVADRAHRSGFDRRAINVTGHLLLSVASLERRIASVPKQLSAVVEAAGRNASIGRVPGPVVARATGNES
jgi:hypothetical protein